MDSLSDSRATAELSRRQLFERNEGNVWNRNRTNRVDIERSLQHDSENESRNAVVDHNLAHSPKGASRNV